LAAVLAATLGFAVPNHHLRSTPHPSRTSRVLRRSWPGQFLLAALVAGAWVAGTGVASAEPEAPASKSWLESIRAQCEQQYSVEECLDHAFLNEHFHVDSLQAARRTAIQRHNHEERALRELLLQRACSNKRAYCTQNAAVGCAEQLTQMCTAIAQQAKACLEQARQYCTAFPQNGACFKQRLAQCPSAKKQSLDVLLAKYPNLSDQQQLHVRQVARNIDTNLGGNWIGDLFRWLGF
jgi:hypothetical protein